jgi:SNF2 family DNA or RNA helicase
VEVHRILINDTVEDRILELQKRKQEMADGALSEGSSTQLGRLGFNELLHLFRGPSDVTRRS